jgi:hypothetical protein
VIQRGASPTDLQSQAIDVQVSSHVAGCRQAKHFERRKASAQFVVVVRIFRGAGSASSGTQCFVGDAVKHQTEEGTVKSTHCVLVCTANFAVVGSTWERLGLADVKQQPKVEVH